MKLQEFHSFSPHFLGEIHHSSLWIRNKAWQTTSMYRLRLLFHALLGISPLRASPIGQAGSNHIPHNSIKNMSTFKHDHLSLQNENVPKSKYSSEWLYSYKNSRRQFLLETASLAWNRSRWQQPWYPEHNLIKNLVTSSRTQLTQRLRLKVESSRNIPVRVCRPGVCTDKPCLATTAWWVPYK